MINSLGRQRKWPLDLAYAHVKKEFFFGKNRHSDSIFPTCDLTTSIISLWSVDSGIKGCIFWKTYVSVWEQKGWPWHVMTVCHLWYLEQITVTGHPATPHCFPAKMHVWLHKACPKMCFNSSLWRCNTVQWIFELKGKNTFCFLFSLFFLAFAGYCRDVSEVFTWIYDKA